MAETVNANPFAILMPAFEAWFDKAVPESKALDFSPYDLCLMAYMAGHSASCRPPDPAVAELVEALHGTIGALGTGRHIDHAIKAARDALAKHAVKP